MTRPLLLPESMAPLHERVAEAVEGLIASGIYRPGDRLPSHRELARQAGVAIGTVTRAIDLLSSRGIIRGEVGRGTFINASEATAVPGGVVDLTINGPPPIIEESAFLAATERAVRKAASLPNGGYADLRGTADQRTVMAGWLSRTRLEVGPDEILLCVGAQHAIYLAFADLKSCSEVIATEGSTFPGAIAAAADLGMTLAPVAHDGEGMLPDALDRVLTETGGRIVYTTPVCQNPLGFETGDERRRAIMAVCRKHGAFIVEDDIYSLYAAKGEMTYKAMAPDSVYYVTSLSKSLSPLTRVGVLAPPAERRSSLARRLRAQIWGAAPLALEIGCAMLELGIHESVAKILLSEARQRAQLTRTILHLDHLPMPQGAPHIWLPMPLLDAEKLARRASERGVRLTPPDATAIGGQGQGGVRLCVMAPPRRADLERALRTVAELRDNPDEAII